jgi:hypothetical protein
VRPGGARERDVTPVSISLSAVSRLHLLLRERWREGMRGLGVGVGSAVDDMYIPACCAKTPYTRSGSPCGVGVCCVCVSCCLSARLRDSLSLMCQDVSSTKQCYQHRGAA